jgi:hypothetical protein
MLPARREGPADEVALAWVRKRPERALDFHPLIVRELLQQRVRIE